MKTEPKFKLLILAGGDFSPYAYLAKKLNVGKKLIVLKNIRNIGDYINASNVGISTSENESFGMASLESMSYGKPVLTTRIGGIPEVVEDKKTGFLLKVGDIEGFVSKLTFLMRNPGLAIKMGKEGKELACKKFCAKKIVPQYLNLYQKVLQKKN